MLKRIPSVICIVLVKLYRLFLRPVIGASCRFTPSCSKYCELSIREFGALRGIGLTLKRLARCHAFCRGGTDPVPSANAQKSE